MKHKDMPARAKAIAYEAHTGQLDKAGRPYVEHAERVAQRFCPEHDPHACAAAWLHDVVEDCPAWTLERLRAEGFCDAIVEAVDLLTKRPEDQDDTRAYVRRLRGNPTAYNVKIADLLDNINLARIPLEQITVKDLRRVNNYAKMLGLLIAQIHADYGEMVESLAKARVKAVVVNLATGEEQEVELPGAPEEKKGAVH